MTNPPRRHTFWDELVLRADAALRAVSGGVSGTGRTYPANGLPEAELSLSEKKHIAGLMRVNHAGEVSAQALYHGQGLVSRERDVKRQLADAAIEEGDHLDWCNRRLAELESHRSVLAPVWYLGSFLIGIAAGAIHDKYSLGFVAETEAQVVQHLQKHLDAIPAKDLKTIKILQQMQTDEARHHDEANDAGAVLLPAIVKKLMNITAQMMVKTAYWI